MELQLSVQGVEPVKELADLANWLRQVPELRGRVKPGPAVPALGELSGGVVEVLIAVLGTSGAAKALASSLTTYLSRPRRSGVRITVMKNKGFQVELDDKNAEQAERLLRIVMDHEEEEG